MRYCDSIPEAHEEKIQKLVEEIFPEWAKWEEVFGEEAVFSSFAGRSLSHEGLPNSDEYINCLGMHLVSYEGLISPETEERLKALAAKLRDESATQPGARSYFRVLESEVTKACADMPLTRRRVFFYANCVSDYFLFRRRM